MTKDIEQLVDECEKCQVHGTFQQKETLKQTFAEHPMQMNSIDLAEHDRKMYLIHADRYSNFLWIYELKQTSTREIIGKLWRTFYQMGFPEYIRSDNGPQFISEEFISKCKQYNIEQEWSDPHYPTSNGHAEKMVGVAKAMIKKATNEVELQEMVHVYNSTPSPKLAVCPSEMLMQRRLRSFLPTLQSSGFVPHENIRRATERKRTNAMQTKTVYDKSAKDLPPIPIGTNVRVYNTKTSRWDIRGVIVFCDPKTGRSYRIHTTNDVYIYRNRRFIKPISRFDRATKPLEGHVRYMPLRQESPRLRE